MNASNGLAGRKAALGGVLLFLCACAAPYRPLPYIPKPANAPEPLVCHDAIGHQMGNRPWVYGGTCCCTPTRENYALHVSSGTIDPAVTYEEFLGAYRAKGILTDLDHRACGNHCAAGPHVTLGGRCMATPVPGTAMYERVTFGPHTTAGWAAGAR